MGFKAIFGKFSNYALSESVNLLNTVYFVVQGVEVDLNNLLKIWVDQSKVSAYNDNENNRIQF